MCSFRINSASSRSWLNGWKLRIIFKHIEPWPTNKYYNYNAQKGWLMHCFCALSWVKLTFCAAASLSHSSCINLNARNALKFKCKQVARTFRTLKAISDYITSTRFRKYCGGNRLVTGTYLLIERSVWIRTVYPKRRTKDIYLYKSNHFLLTFYKRLKQNLSWSQKGSTLVVNKWCPEVRWKKL